MTEEDDTLFLRGSENENTDDIWDDTLLIKAYDRAINLAKDEVSKRMGLHESLSTDKTKTVPSQRVAKKWTVGSPCRAIYSEDGEVYEAIVKKIFDNYDNCIVEFVGYGNTEKVDLSSLMESDGLQSQIQQQKVANAQKCSSHEKFSGESNLRKSDAEQQHMECDPPINQPDKRPSRNFCPPSASYTTMMGGMPPPPPLPPQLMSRLPENDSDALSSMLMSWYISGFHTGYYHGLNQARKNRGSRTSND